MNRVWLAVILIFLVSIQTADAQETMISGEGRNYDEAVKNSLMNALQRGIELIEPINDDNRKLFHELNRYVNLIAVLEKDDDNKGEVIILAQVQVNMEKIKEKIISLNQEKEQQLSRPTISFQFINKNFNFNNNDKKIMIESLNNQFKEYSFNIVSYEGKDKCSFLAKNILEILEDRKKDNYYTIKVKNHLVVYQSRNKKVIGEAINETAAIHSNRDRALTIAIERSAIISVNKLSSQIRDYLDDVISNGEEYIIVLKHSTKRKTNDFEKCLLRLGKLRKIEGNKWHLLFKGGIDVLEEKIFDDVNGLKYSKEKGGIIEFSY